MHKCLFATGQTSQAGAAPKARSCAPSPSPSLSICRLFSKASPSVQQALECVMQRHHTHAPPLTQAVCATAIAQLIQLCLGRKPSPVDKLLKNLCAMAWGDPGETPPITAADCTAALPTAGSIGGSPVATAQGCRCRSLSVTPEVTASLSVCTSDRVGAPQPD